MKSKSVSVSDISSKRAREVLINAFYIAQNVSGFEIDKAEIVRWVGGFNCKLKFGRPQKIEEARKPTPNSEIAKSLCFKCRNSGVCDTQKTVQNVITVCKNYMQS